MSTTDIDCDDMMTPEQACAAYADVLNPAHPRHAVLARQAKTWARWVLANGPELERAMLEEVADTHAPHVVPFLVTGGVLEAERRYELEVLVPARVRWARNRASKKVARGRELSEAERAAWERAA